MSGPDRRDDGLPATIRAAMRRGWRGLAVAARDGPGPLRVVCAVPAGRLDALAAEGVAVGLAPGPRGASGRPCRVTLALVGEPTLALTLDLGFSDARAMAARLAGEGELELLWARAEDAGLARAEVVVLPPAVATRLRDEVALQGEWRTHDPEPVGFSRAGWAREAGRPSAARLVRGDLPGAPVMVLAPLSDGSRARPGPPDVSLSFPGGPPVPEAATGVRLWLDGPRQRALAEWLAVQRSVIVLLVDVAGRWAAQVEIGLGRDGRALMLEGARRSLRRQGRGPAGTRRRRRAGGR